MHKRVLLKMASLGPYNIEESTKKNLKYQTHFSRTSASQASLKNLKILNMFLPKKIDEIS